ncbi:MAG: VTT domain-containing protein [Chloroflexota bacterium]|nr:VTT domain-containing protein [Chloroflexota bacterium]
MDLSFASSYGIAAIFVIMLVKEIGVPVPIPSDLLMIAAGIQIASAAYSLPALVGALALAVLIGGSIQFVLARSVGRAVVYRIASAVGIPAERLDRSVGRLRAGGARAAFVGLNIPGARAAVIPAAGLARLRFVPFTIATTLGSLAFYGWHIALGYLVGPAAITLLERYTAPGLALLLLVALAGLAAWVAMRRRAGSGDRDAARSWTEAACPACLAVTVLRPRP